MRPVLDRMKRSQRSCLLCLRAGFLIGLLAGWLSLTVFVSARLDDYHRLIRQYVSAITEKDTRLKKLEASLAAVQKRRHILQDITLHLEYSGGEIERIALEEYARAKFSGLLGKEVKDIDVELIGTIIDGRLAVVEEKEYVYQLHYAVLTESLILWLSVRRAD